MVARLDPVGRALKDCLVQGRLVGVQILRVVHSCAV